MPGASPRRSPRKGKFAVGAAIEARYKGKSKYYPGKIAKANDDGSYDIAYDDGESEANVIEALIRPLGGAAPARAQRPFRDPSEALPGPFLQALRNFLRGPTDDDTLRSELYELVQISPDLPRSRLDLPQISRLVVG